MVQQRMAAESAGAIPVAVRSGRGCCEEIVGRGTGNLVTVDGIRGCCD